MPKPKYILTFSQISIKDIPKVGGKNASLGEMFKHLTKKGISIPAGFCTTAKAFQYYLDYNYLIKPIKEILLKLDKNKVKDLEQSGAKIRALILRSKFPPDFAAEIIKD
ncbi:MAG: phosphoenolpyruvate synthase, partial [Candidatus Parcubacteria bacterium]|nr:phosphoenolpyruvate synthase [Candidatus Parcubacteria bacterium]